MDHQAVNKLFVDDLLAVGTSAMISWMLVPERPKFRELCRQSEDCRIIAIDMAVHARPCSVNIEVDGFTQRIFLQQIDAKDMLFESEMFDWPCPTASFITFQNRSLCWLSQSE